MNPSDSATDGDGANGAGSTDSDVPEDVRADARRDAPDWEHTYLDRVADRLAFNYDLEKDRSIEGERFEMYGRMRIESEKHFFHPSLSYANHGSTEHLFCRVTDRATIADCERLREVATELAAAWIDADEEHYSTDFTFVLVVPEIAPALREFVEGFRDRTLLKFGYYGHYEINFVVVSPEQEDCIASRNAHVAEAFRLWDPIERDEPGLFDLITRRLQI